MTGGSRSLQVKVPATSANLGPGFDTLGLALSVYDELVVETVPGTDQVTVEVHGEGAGEVPLDDSHLVVATMRRACEVFGCALPGLRLRAHNTIPHGRGMGSSGAAVVAGLMVVRGLLQPERDVTKEELLRLATDIEGHPDNVAPALFGGLTIAWVGADGPQNKSLQVHRGVAPALFVPEFTMSTKLARSLQPEHVSRADAVFNVSRSALLIAALTQSPELLLAATEDRLHQDYRAGAMPETLRLVRVLRDAGFPAVVSGAGPSILLLADGPAARQAAAEVVREHAETHWQAQMVAVDVRGATVEERERVSRPRNLG